MATNSNMASSHTSAILRKQYLRIWLGSPPHKRAIQTSTDNQVRSNIALSPALYLFSVEPECTVSPHSDHLAFEPTLVEYKALATFALRQISAVHNAIQTMITEPDKALLSNELKVQVMEWRRLITRMESGKEWAVSEGECLSMAEKAKAYLVDAGALSEKLRLREVRKGISLKGVEHR